MPKTLSERIRWILYHKNISKLQIAKDAEVGSSAVNYWISGRVNDLAIDKCLKLSKAYNLPVEWLAGDVEEDPVEFLDKPPQGKPVFLTTEDPVQAMADCKTLKERFRWLVYHRQAVTAEVSRVANVSRPAALGWLLGKVSKLRPEDQKALTEYYKLPANFFSINRDDTVSTTIVPNTVPVFQGTQMTTKNAEPFFIPLSRAAINTDGSCFFLPCEESSPDLWIAINHITKQRLQSSGTAIDDLRCIAVPDNSMAPQFSQQDLVLVDTKKREIIKGQIYLISIQNRAPIIRKLTFDDKQDIVVIAENEEVSKTLIRRTEAALDLRVLGQVVFRAG